jgi:hypothetical protein
VHHLKSLNQSLDLITSWKSIVILRSLRQTWALSDPAAILAVATFLAVAMSVASAEDAELSLLNQSSLTDTPDGPKEQLRSIGIMPDVWVTQFYQGRQKAMAARPGATVVSSTLSLRWMQRNLAFGRASTSMCNTSITSVKT